MDSLAIVPIIAIFVLLVHLSVYILQKKTSAVPRNYDVFLSFKGEDTRTGFTDFLYNGLVDAGIHVFRDNNALPVGKEIGPELLQAISGARIAIPIISIGYSESTSCLRELTEIMDCHTKHRTSVFPVFYKHIFTFWTRKEVKVFLSFRGPDTRRGFAAYFYISLVAAGIKVFSMDDPSLIGKDIAHEIYNAISHCKIFIPILSENYASSHWCLDELAHIVECNKTEQEILPIFYRVKPSDVRDVLHHFKKYMRGQKKLVNKSRYERWERALWEVGSSKGWESEKIAKGHLRFPPEP